MIHLWQNSLILLIATVPGLMISTRRRVIFREMRTFSRELSGRLRAPLLPVLAELVSDNVVASPEEQTETTIRNLADLAVLLESRTDIGYCLRRSLVRFYFLRRAGIPVVIHVGASHSIREGTELVDGHAWLTLEDQPYFELHKNLDSFVVMLSFPEHDAM